jgi:Holliday junction resolvase RusA-like endonuclease
LTNQQFLIAYKGLPPSVNAYLRPAIRMVDDEPVPYMYETKVAKDFKKAFGAYLKREVKKQKWNIEETKGGHWYLDIVFVQSRTNEDNNNYFKVLCDAMVGIVIEDDRNILVRPQMVLYNPKNPSFKAVLHRVAYTGIFKNEQTHDKFIEDNCSGCKRFNRNCSILKKAREGRIQEDIAIVEGFNTCQKKRP